MSRYSPVLCLLALALTIGLAIAPSTARAQTQGLIARPPVSRISVPRIGLIEFFGLSKTSEARVRQALGVREGDFLPRSKGEAEERIDNLPGIVESHLEAVCCQGADMILYIGVEEKGAKHFDLREQPDGEAQLPEDVTKLYRRFLDAAQKAARFNPADDLTQGHALSGDAATRDLQEQFIPVAERYLPELRNVLRNSSDEEQRAMAAYVIAYAPDKTAIVDDLQFALKDNDAGVRSNATRGLTALAVFARLHAASGVKPDSGLEPASGVKPDSGLEPASGVKPAPGLEPAPGVKPAPSLKVEPTWFIEALNSLSFTDRMQALAVLQILTDNRDESSIEQLRDRALPSLVEMARWKALKNALPAFVLVGRLTPLTDTQVQDAWTRGDRESVIAQALASVKKKR